jgi:hypothetical protein
MGTVAVPFDHPDVVYSVPESGSVKLEYRGLPLDVIEDVLPKSAASRQALRSEFPASVRDSV